jgi:hypothetical protein
MPRKFQHNRKRLSCSVCFADFYWHCDKEYLEGFHRCPNCSHFIDGVTTVEEHHAEVKQAFNLRSVKAVNALIEEWKKHNEKHIEFPNGYVERKVETEITLTVPYQGTNKTVLNLY